MLNNDILTTLKDIDAWWESLGVQVDSGLRYADLAPLLQKPPTPIPTQKSASEVDQPVGTTNNTPQAQTFDELVKEIMAFEACPLKQMARNTVVYDGVMDAKVLVFGEAPGADEDAAGKPFVGKAGQLLDNQLAAIGLSRAENCLISNVVFWRPPNNRKPKAEEISQCLPFVMRMIEIVDPAIILTFGGVPTEAILQKFDGITKLRGRKHALKIGSKTYPVFANFHPAFLLRRPHDKARAWRDLLVIQSALERLEIAHNPT